MHTNTKTNCMEQGPSWVNNNLITSQEIPRLLRNPKVYYRVQTIQLLDSVLSQPYPIHTLTSNFLRSILLLCFHLSLRLPSALLPSGFRTKIFQKFLIFRRSSLGNFLHPPITSCLPVMIFCVIIACNEPEYRLNLQGDEWASKVLRNIGILSDHFKASHPRRLRHEFGFCLT
jgi:hypothetical protein